MSLSERLRCLEKQQEIEKMPSHGFLEQAKCFFKLSREVEGKLRRAWYFRRGLAYQSKSITHTLRASAHFTEYWQLRKEMREALQACSRAEGYELKFEHISG